MNRYFITITALALASVTLGAQDTRSAAAAAASALGQAPQVEKKEAQPSLWTESIKTNINFGQTGLTNWAAGGDNTTSLAAYVDANANWKKGVMFWNNRLQLDYGFLYASSKPIIQKNTDRIYLESKWGYQIKDKIYFSANYDFKSQFAKGYNYNTPSGVEPSNSDGTFSSQQWKDARVAKSGLLSPAYTTISLGIDWKPVSWFSASFSPLTGGLVISTDREFRKAYGLKLKNNYDENEYQQALATKDPKVYGKFYNPVKFEFGSQLKVDAKINVNDNFSYTTQLVLFSDYLDSPLDIRTGWDNRFDWKLAKYFSLTVITNMIYDNKIETGSSSKVQFKESLAFGFTYTFAKNK